MVAVQVMKTVGVIIISFIIGFLFFYITSSLSKIERKKQLEEVISQLINFVIFIWLGKIVTNIQVFIRDPLTILAYPSDSSAFYAAVVFSVLTFGYKVVRHNFHIFTFLRSFVPIFLVASFVYEFIGIISSGSAFSWGYLGILMVLLIVYMMIYDRMTNNLTLYLLISWSLGQLLLAFLLPFTTVFGYIVTPTSLIILTSLFLLLLLYNRKKVL